MSSLSHMFSRQKINLIAGLFTLFLVLYVIMYAIPSLFITLFDTRLGNLVLLGFFRTIV